MNRIKNKIGSSTSKAGEGSGNSFGGLIIAVGSVFGRVGAKAIDSFVAARRSVAEVIRNKLSVISSMYKRWRSWKYRQINYKHVNVLVLTIGLVFTGSLMLSTLAVSSASSTWLQDDWSGGIGLSTSSQFSSSDNIDYFNGHITTNSENLLLNSNFGNNLEPWEFYSGNNINLDFAASYTSATQPFHIMTGDLNNDGYVDVAASSETSALVSVFINKGNGSFHPAVNYAVHGNGRRGETVDLDGDGHLDIVVAGYNSNTVSVLMNQGDGTFEAAVSYAVPSRPFGLATGDIDGDGDMDVVVASENTGSNIAVLKNDGYGSLGTSNLYQAASNRHSVVLADLDGDGQLDIAASGSTSAISVFKNTGSGSFSPVLNTSVGGTAWGDISFGDVDGDGDTDLLVGTSNGMILLINGGSANFSGKMITPGDYGLDLVDLDNDGSLDIVATGAFLTNLSIHKNNGSGIFSALSDIAAGSASYGVASADLNKDGNYDIIFASRASGQIKVYMNNTNDLRLSDVHSYSGGHSAMVTTSTAGPLYQSVKLAPGHYLLEAYAYINGAEVSTDDVVLYAGSTSVSATSITETDRPGWYRLSAVIEGSNIEERYGVYVKSGGVFYLDDISILKYTTGSLTSNVYDTQYGSEWGELNYEVSAGEVVVKVRSGNTPDLSDAADFAGCGHVVSGTVLSDTSCVQDNHRYIQYQVALDGSSGISPRFEEISIEYQQYDKQPPNINASNILMKKAVGGEVVSDGSWTNGGKPYFEWGSGSDEGSGIKGYCLYLGVDPSADPITTKGLFGDSPVDSGGHCQFVVDTSYIDTATVGYLGSPLTSSNESYYLNIKAIDNANNVFQGDSESFSFKFDDTPPKNPDFITAPSQFVANKEVTLTWPVTGQNAAQDSNSGLAGLQYRIGNNGTWYGSGHTGAQDHTDLLSNSGTYTTIDPYDFDVITEGNNVVYFRTWDNAGNISIAYVTTVIRYNSSAPSSPQNLTASPSSNTANSFSFSWVEPANFQGQANSITYCYTVNTLPSANTCTYTGAGVLSLPVAAYATQPGENTLYLVATDETGNINYATAASVTFIANTAAPGIPLDLEIADVSTKATSSWKLALSWSAPGNTGVGISSYRIDRSTNGISFNQVATTGGTSYVDSGLSQQRYYYRIRACDSANNCGAYSGVVNDSPTGRFTEPAGLISQPSVSVSTRSATIKWATDRDSDSRIQYGLASGNYFSTEAAISSQTKNHQIDLSNLDAGTTYFYKARWTDEDGNVGASSELSFTTLPAPVIKDVQVRRVTMTTAIIQFTTKSSSKVNIYYGKSDAFGGLREVNTSASESTYTIELGGLDDGTKYYFGINPVDVDGNEYRTTRIDTFSTPPRPRISELRFQPVEGEPTSTQRVTWRTNVPATSLVRFSSGDIPTKEHTEPGMKTEHEITVRNLIDDTEYSITAESRDGDGNLAVSDSQSLRTALDTRPPKVSDVVIETTIRGTGAEARGQIVISWKTDEPATSQVAYSEGSRASEFNNRTAEDTTLATEHIVIVSDLPTSRVFSVMPVSRDRSQNVGQGDASTAIIGRSSDSILTVVLNSLRKVFGF